MGKNLVNLTNLKESMALNIEGSMGGTNSNPVYIKP
jgi:hypothetical protein